MKKMYRTKDGFDVRIVREKKSRYIMYCDEYGYMFSVGKKEIEKPFSLLMYNFGYIKTDDIDYIDGISKRLAWVRYKSMIHRVYSGYERHKAYRNVTVCDEWRNFVNFEKWFNENNIDGFVMDKDMLSEPDNKIYSPVTCCFIPRSINGIGNNKNSIELRNGKYGFSIADSAGVHYIPVGSKEEAERFKKICGRLRIDAILNEYKHLIKLEVRDKILSLYD